MRTALLIVGGALLLGIGFSVGLVVGLVGGNRQAYHLRYLEERELLAPVLRGDSAFKSLELTERSQGGADLGGELETADDLERLRAAVARAIGEARAQEVVYGVAAPGR